MLKLTCQWSTVSGTDESEKGNKESDHKEASPNAMMTTNRTIDLNEVLMMERLEMRLMERTLRDRAS